MRVVDAAGFHLPEASIRTGLATAHWPGRFERIAFEDRVLVFDGAHTPAAAAALVEAWRDDVGTDPATVIVGMGADKDAAAFLTELRPLIGQLIVTRADSPRSASPKLIARAAAELDIPHEIQPSVAVALDVARTRDRGPVLITGSLFVVGEGREAVGLAEPDREWLALNRAGVASMNAGPHP
jgi:dihydrofolate synthase/folylpolyglutamate synthase